MNSFAPAVFKPASGARPVLIHTGDFQGSSAPPTVNAPIEKVQTGGFGDPNGLKPSEHSKPNGKLMAATAGSFDMPVGPGQGNGSGGAKGIKGTVASADFGSGVATGGQGRRTQERPWRGIQPPALARRRLRRSRRHAQRMDVSLTSNAVEITYKPNPVYTDEARAMRLEGEVLLEVQFSANGQLHVNRVVRGLGHGLDEAADSQQPTKCASRLQCATGNRWIRRQSFTWSLHWHTETLETGFMRSVMRTSNWMVLGTAGSMTHDVRRSTAGVCAAKSACQSPAAAQPPRLSHRQLRARLIAVHAHHHGSGGRPRILREKDLDQDFSRRALRWSKPTCRI